ncbi:hypothetical protein QUF72_08255 [Desulfobacterales bacterium HSG2]|nr:hypothetical protein [Desulfobacterales bacterium HSG2]
MFQIFLTDEAKAQLNRLKTDRGLQKRYGAVKKPSVFWHQIQNIRVSTRMNLQA